MEEQAVRRGSILPRMLPLLLLTVLALAAGRGQSLAAVIASRVQFCLQTLIPSLFICMVLANLLRESGAAGVLGRRARLTARLLHLSPSGAGIFWISQLAGYPVGTLLLRRQYENGAIPASDAARLACVCFGGGPAFAVGFAGAGLLGSPAAGWVMLGACIAANLLTGAVICRNITPKPAQISTRCTLTAENLTGAVSAAQRSLAAICGTVLLFGGVYWLAETAGLIRLLESLCGMFGVRRQVCGAVTAAVSDLTQLAPLAECGLQWRVLLPLTAALLSFGGICVHLQCISLGGGVISAKKLLTVRLCTALTAALLTAAAMSFLPVPEAEAVFSVRVLPSESGSVVPGLLIFCTGFPFLIKKD